MSALATPVQTTPLQSSTTKAEERPQLALVREEQQSEIQVFDASESKHGLGIYGDERLYKMLLGKAIQVPEHLTKHFELFSENGPYFGAEGIKLEAMLFALNLFETAVLQKLVAYDLGSDDFLYQFRHLRKVFFSDLRRIHDWSEPLRPEHGLSLYLFSRMNKGRIRVGVGLFERIVPLPQPAPSTTAERVMARFNSRK